MVLVQNTYRSKDLYSIMKFLQEPLLETRVFKQCSLQSEVNGRLFQHLRENTFHIPETERIAKKVLIILNMH